MFLWKYLRAIRHLGCTCMILRCFLASRKSLSYSQRGVAWLPHVRPLNHLYEGKGSKTLGKEKRVTKRNVASRFGQSDGLRVNRNLQHPRKSRVIYPSAPLFCPPSLIFRLLSLFFSHTPYYPELRLIDTRLPAVIYISRVI